MMNKDKIFPTNRIRCALFVSLTTIFLMVNNIGVMAQSYVNTTGKDSISLTEGVGIISPLNQDTIIHEVVEEMPEYPGGLGEFMKFLAQNVKYPKKALKKKIQGRVMVQFVVDRDGSITNIKIERGVSPSLDAEALRVIKIMPKWKPGKQNGKPVRALFHVPIMFRI